MKTRTIVLWTWICLVLPAHAAVGGTIGEYSADRVFFDGKSVLLTARIYVSGRNLRCDVPAHLGRAAMSTIVRGDTQKIFLILHSDRTYAETTGDGDVIPGGLPVMLGAKMEKSGLMRLGTEQIQGYTATKYRFVAKYGGRRNGRPRVHLEWVAPEFDLPLRSMLEGEPASQELRNIKVGPVPAHVFDLPAGYAKAKDVLTLMKASLHLDG